MDRRRCAHAAALSAVACLALAACGDDATATRPTPVPTSPQPSAQRAKSSAPAPTAAPAERPQGRCRLVASVARDGKPVACRVEATRRPARTSREDGRIWFADELDTPRSGRPLAADAATKGRYVLDGLAAGTYVVAAAADDGGVAHADVEFLADGAENSVELRISAATQRTTLRGRVVAPDAAPFHGLVCATTSDATGDPFETASWRPTADDGSFALDVAAGARVVVAALLPDHLRALGPATSVPTDAPYVLELSRTLAAVGVRVFDETTGRPVVGADVGVCSGELPYAYCAERTDAEGRCTLRLTPGRRPTLYVHARGYPPVGELEIDPAEKEIDVALRAGPALVVHVVSAADGSPVAGAPVFVHDYGDEGASGGRPPVVSGADGAARFSGLLPGEVLVFAMGGGWYSEGLELGRVVGEASSINNRRPRRPPDVLPANGTADITICATPAAAVDGVVLRHDGTPVAGAVVASHAASMVPFVGDTGYSFDSFPTPSAVTGADGRFRIEGLFPPVRYGLSATAVGEPGVARCEIEARDARGAALRFAAPHGLDVAVLDAATGAPIVGADVSCSDKTSSNWNARGPGEAATADRDGVARIGPVVAGAYDVAATARGYLPAPPQDVAFVDGAPPPARLVFRLTIGARLRGHVALPDGSLPDGATASIRDDESRRRRFSRGPSSPAEAAIAGDGSFEIVGVEPGAHTVSVEAQRAGKRFTGRASAETGDRVVEVALAPVEESADSGRTPDRPTFAVRVLGPDGVPVGRAWIHATWTDDGTTQGTSFDVVRGIARLPLAARGTEVTVSGARSLTGIPCDAATLRATVPADAADGFEFRLARGVSTTGRVEDDAHRPVAGVPIRARVPRPRDDPFAWANMKGDLASTAVSGADGSFELRGLDATDYELHVEAPDDFEPPDAQTATGGVRDVVVRIVRGTRPVVIVLDPQDKPISDARVTVSKKGFGFGLELATAETGPDGRATLSVLPHGRVCELTVTTWGKGFDSFSDGEWTPTPERVVHLARLGNVSGRVLLPDGSPAGGVAVWWRAPRVDGERPMWSSMGGEWSGVTSDAQGRFSVEGVRTPSVDLIAGNYVAYACNPNGGREQTLGAEDAVVEPLVTSATTGATDVTLHLLAERIVRVRLVGLRGPLGADDLPTLHATEGRDLLGCTPTSDPAVFLFSGVAPTRTYELLARVPRMNLVGRIAEVRGGKDVDVTLEPGVALEGRIVAPDAAASDRFTVQFHVAGVSVAAEAGGDGRFVIPCLPRVDGSVEASGRWPLHGWVKATPGTPVEIPLAQSK